MAAERIRLTTFPYLPSYWVKKHLCTWQSGGYWAIHLAALQIKFIHPAVIS